MKKSFEDRNEPNTYQVVNFDDAYSYYYINNEKGKSKVSSTIQFGKMEGLTFLPPNKGKEAKL